MPVTRKPPVGVNKKMTQKGDQFEDYYLDEENTSARSSPGARRRSYHDREGELCQDDTQRVRSSSVGGRSCHEENPTEYGKRSNHESGEDDWILVDPKTDREFMDTIRRRILQCVSTNSGEEEDGVNMKENTRKEAEGEGNMKENMREEVEEGILKENMREEAEEDWAEREKRELRASLSSLNAMDDKGWDVKEELRMVPRNEDDSEDQDHGALKEERESDHYPSRKIITNFVRECTIFQEDLHRQNLMHIVKSYIKKVKKEKIIDIIDTILSEEEANTEDAIFLISEVLYGE